jgi:hypothetical protein
MRRWGNEMKTTIMKVQIAPYGDSLACECGFSSRVTNRDGWKFCPGCAAVIVRFEIEREQTVEIAVTKAPRKKLEMVVGVEKL